MNRIHRTAVVDPDAMLGDGNIIGPFCYIGPNVKIGNRNKFVGYVSVGLPPEHKAYWDKEPGPVEVGDENIIREFCTINGATFAHTKMGNRNIMLRGSHLSHDSVLEDDITISCSVLIGGETYVMRGANLALGSIVHQKQVIGAFSMIGMGAVVTKKLDVVPGNIYAGNPAKFLKRNDVGIHRARISEGDLMIEINRYKEIRGGD